MKRTKRDAARWQKMINGRISKATVIPFEPKKTVRRAGFGITYNPRRYSFRIFNSIFFMVVLCCVWFYIGK